jgi:hypothetical protein
MRFQAVVAAALLVSAAACSKSKSSASEVQYGLLSASPSSVKANYEGVVTLTGVGLSGLSRVYVGGVPVEDVLPVTVEHVDSHTIRLHFDYGGIGYEHPVGWYQLGVSDGFQVGTTTGLGVRAVLQSVEHVRTFPGDFTLSGGTFWTWLRPTDHLGALVAPGSEIAGPGGLTASSFVSEDVQLVPPGGGTPFLATLRNVNHAEWDPVNDTRPMSVAMAIDQSGSMISPEPGSDPNDERVNQTQLFVDRMTVDSEAAVWKFHGPAGGVDLVVDWTGNKDALKTGLDSLRTGEGGTTPLYDAMMVTVNAAATRSTENLRAAIVLTDGLDNTSTATPQNVIDLARNLEIPVFAIGLGNPSTPGSIDQATLSNISAQTGGVFYFAEDAEALDTVFASLTEVLKSSYRVEVSFQIDPPLTTPGAYDVFGKVRVQADGEDALVQLPAFRASVAE